MPGLGPGYGRSLHAKPVNVPWGPAAPIGETLAVGVGAWQLSTYRTPVTDSHLAQPLREPIAGLAVGIGRCGEDRVVAGRV